MIREYLREMRKFHTMWGSEAVGDFPRFPWLTVHKFVMVKLRLHKKLDETIPNWREIK